MSESNVEALRRSMEGWNRGDFDAFTRPFHPEIEFFSAITREAEGSERAWRGIEGARLFWDEWHALWSLTVELSDVRDLGDTVIGLGVVRTRGSASGVELTSPVAYVCELEAGLFRSVRAYRDPNAALRAVGLADEYPPHPPS